MSWVRIDDHAHRHPKQLQAGPMACWLWVCGLSYCSEHLTDGYIPSAALPTFSIPRVDREAERLVEVGLWEVTDSGYRVHDYHEYQPSKGQVTARRKRTHARVTDWRKRHGYAHGNGDVTQDVTLLQTPMKRACTHPPDPDPDPSTDTSLRSVSVRAREGDGERLWELFRTQALALRDATLPLTCRAVEQGSLVEFLARYPDPGKWAWLIDAYLMSRHRPIASAPLSIGQLCKWASWLEAQATAPAPDSMRTSASHAPAPEAYDEWCHHKPRCSSREWHAMLRQQGGVTEVTG
jgi:hypothetical protein